MYSKYYDSITNIDYTVIEGEVYTVYIRRSNGRKRIAFVSRSAAKAFSIYHGLKVFKQDRKYLTAKSDGVERNLAAIAGTVPKPNSINHKGVKSVSKIRAKQVIVYMAETLLDEIAKTTHQQVSNKGKHLSRNQVIPILYSYFLDCSIEQKNEIIKKGEEIYIKHKYMSGGDNDENAEKLLRNKKVKDEDLELL